MTLIIASIRPKEIVITADGRSVTTDKGVVTRVDDRFQKLFPNPDHPVIVAQFGENQFGGKSIGQILSDFMHPLNVGNFTIEQLADELRRFVHPIVRKRLKELDRPTVGCGFWVAGFTAIEESPKLVELFWSWKKPTLLTEEKQYSPITIALGGDGKKQVEAPDWHAIEGKSIDQIRDYHQRMMQQAIDAKIDHNSVGGHVHELIIDRTEWTWTRKPAT